MIFASFFDGFPANIILLNYLVASKGIVGRPVVLVYPTHKSVEKIRKKEKDKSSQQLLDYCQS